LVFFFWFFAPPPRYLGLDLDELLLEEPPEELMRRRRLRLLLELIDPCDSSDVGMAELLHPELLPLELLDDESFEDEERLLELLYSEDCRLFFSGSAICFLLLLRLPSTPPALPAALVASPSSRL
jgi:hypothetical protein